MNLDRNCASFGRHIHAVTICIALMCQSAQQDAHSKLSSDDQLTLTGTVVSSAEEADNMISLQHPRLSEKPFENKIFVKHRLHYDIDIDGFYEHKPSTLSSGVLLALHHPDSGEWIMLTARGRATLPDPFQTIATIDLPIAGEPKLLAQTEQRARVAGMNGWMLHGKLTMNAGTLDVNGWIGQGERHDYALYHIYPAGTAEKTPFEDISNALQHSDSYATAGTILSLLMPSSLKNLDWSPYGFKLNSFTSDAELISDNTGHEMGIVIYEISAVNDFWGIQAFCHGDLENTPVALATSMIKAIDREYPVNADQVDYLDWKNERLLRIKLQTYADETTYWFESVIIPGEYCSHHVFANSNDGAKQTSSSLIEVLNQFNRSAISGAKPFDLTEAHKNFFNDAGIYYYDQGDYETASEYFAQSVILLPDDDQIIENWFTALSYSKKYAEGILATEIVASSKTLSLTEKSWKHYFQYQIGDYAAAEAGYLNIFEQGYDNVEDMLIYMDLLNIEERYEDILAFVASNEALFDDSTNDNKAKFRSYHASSLMHTDQSEAALETVDIAITQLGEKPELIEAKILILEDLNKLSELRDLAEDLISRGVAKASTYYSLGLAEYQQSHYQKAYDYLTKAVVLDPGNAMYAEDLMTISGMIGQGDQRLLSDDQPPLMLPSVWTFTPAAVTTDNESDYVIDKMYKLIHFEPDEKLVKTYYMDYVIHNETGAESLNTLNISFDPLNEQIGVNSLVVYDQNGTVLAEGDRNTYYIRDESGSEASFEKSLYIPVPKTGPGRRIQLVVTITSQQNSDLFDFEELHIGSSRPVKHAGIWFTGDINSVKYESYKAGDPRTHEDGLLWELEDVPAYRNETMAADPLYEIPRLTLVGRDQTWFTVGSDYYSSIDSLLGYDEQILSLVNQIAPQSLSTDQRIRNISEYVQQIISYTAIEFGARGYTPKSPNTTLEDRYGDCKDHAVILHAMLEAAGINSRLVLVNLDMPVAPEMPSLDQFDHMIVEARTPDNVYYLDATDKELPLSKYPPRSLAGNMGLALGSKPEQVFIPPYPADSRKISSKRFVELDNNGYMRVNETLTASGYAAAAYRGDLSSRTSQNRRDRIQDYLNSSGNHLKLKDLAIKNIDNNQLPLIIELSYETTAIPLNLPGFIPDLPSIFEQQWIPPTWYENRQTEFKVEYPLHFTTEITLVDKSSTSMFADSLETVSMQSRFGDWELSAMPDSNQLGIRFQYNEHAATYSAEHYDEYETFSSTAVRVLGNAARLSLSAVNGQIITSR